MSNFITASPNFVILMITFSIIVASIRAYFNKDRKWLLANLFLAVFYKYLLMIYSAITTIGR